MATLDFVLTVSAKLTRVILRVNQCKSRENRNDENSIKLENSGPLVHLAYA